MTREEYKRARRRDLYLIALVIIISIGAAFLAEAVMPVCM